MCPNSAPAHSWTDSGCSQAKTATCCEHCPHLETQSTTVTFCLQTTWLLDITHTRLPVVVNFIFRQHLEARTFSQGETTVPNVTYMPPLLLVRRVEAWQMTGMQNIQLAGHKGVSLPGQVSGILKSGNVLCTMVKGTSTSYLTAKQSAQQLRCSRGGQGRSPLKQQ